MKIGILTFHSQLNYGGVLQCWALQQTLKDMGHEVVVVDRWITKDNSLLDGPFGHAGFKGWLNIALHVLAGCGHFGMVLRHWRTRRFVKALGLTPYHFYHWQEAPQDLGIDCLVVGSDQVWHGGDWAWPTPDPYLLKDAPAGVPAIAYAASFGMKTLPEGIDYAGGFKRFSAISVREKEAVKLVESQGGRAVHVVDPTLLLASEKWRRMGIWKKVSRRVVCYFLSENIPQMVKQLEPWARRNDLTVEVLCGWSQFEPFPQTAKMLFMRAWAVLSPFIRPPRVRICSGYGPREFVRAFAQAEMCITNSFHAVMFSSINQCNLRFLKPQSDMRKSMFARVEEFANSTMRGDPFVENLSDALASLDSGVVVSFDKESIAAQRIMSYNWLVQALPLP